MNMTRQLLAVALITLTLAGIQVVQASPLHDHVSHFNGCALCHFSGTEAVIPATPVTLDIPIGRSHQPVPVITLHDTSSPSSFRSRAPPVTSL